MRLDFAVAKAKELRFFLFINIMGPLRRVDREFYRPPCPGAPATQTRYQHINQDTQRRAEERENTCAWNIPSIYAWNIPSIYAWKSPSMYAWNLPSTYAWNIPSIYAWSSPSIYTWSGDAVQISVTLFTKFWWHFGSLPYQPAGRGNLHSGTPLWRFSLPAGW